MKIIRAYIVIAAVFLAINGPLWAQDADDFYTAAVGVPDDSLGARNRALRTGLLEILVRLSGSRGIANHAAVQNLLDDVKTYVLEFGYVQVPVANKDDSGYSLAVRARYAGTEIENFLRRHQLPIWPVNRPSMLVWVMVEDVQSPRGFVLNEGEGARTLAIEQQFKRRGLPVTFPLYDLEDQENLSVEQGWSLDGDALAEASSRYPVDAWLLVRCYQTSSLEWRGAWALGKGRDTSVENLKGETLEQLLAMAADEAVDRLAEQYAYVATSVAGRLDVDIAGIRSFEDYRLVTGLLKNSSMVRSMVLKKVLKDRLLIRLDVEGSEQQFLDTLRLSDRILVSESQPTTGETLHLQLRPVD